MMNYYGGDLGFMMPFGFGIFGLIFMVAWWGLIIWAIVLFVQWINRSAGGQGLRHRGSALDIAKERYAKGEINREEFEEIKRELTT